MSNFMSRCSTAGRRSDDTMDDDTDDKDDTKRKSRNLSEKKRRDQFNLLINELSSMVSTNSRKMDKSTVLKSTISFLKNHNDIAVRSRVHEIQEEWKPAFLSNEEFTHLILEALDGFIIVFSSNGRILYASESVTALLGHLPNDLLNMTIYDVVYDDDQTQLYNMFLNPVTNVLYENNKDNQISFVCHCKRGNLDFSQEVSYELVRFVGYFRADMESLQIDNGGNNRYSGFSGEADTRLVFVGIGRLQTPQLIREMSIVDSAKSEFTSRHSLEWKFLFLDHRASQIIGYLPFEVLGTSGYDYYHVDDLDKVITCHETLMQKGEGTSCYYRFLTKGQQWIWLQTRFYITYHQWNSKPEFVVCTHRVISHINVIKQLLKDSNCTEQGQEQDYSCEPTQPESSPWPSNRSVGNVIEGNKTSHYEMKNFANRGGESDTSLSADSVTSRNSQLTSHSQVSKRSRCVSSSVPKMVPVPTSKVAILPEFIEPPATYSVATLSLQPVAFTSPTTIVAGTTLPTSDATARQPLVMSCAQSQIQDQLQKKHKQLQQMIVQQQEELRRVSEQLFMARFGLLSPVMNVTLPYTVSPAAAPHLSMATPTTSDLYSSQRPHLLIDPNEVNFQAPGSALPFSFQPQDPQNLLFPQSLDSPNSTQNSQ